MFYRLLRFLLLGNLCIGLYREQAQSTDYCKVPSCYLPRYHLPLPHLALTGVVSFVQSFSETGSVVAPSFPRTPVVE